LSAEIIAITLGTVQGSPFITQVAVLSGIAIAMTAGVYGLVAGIVKIDDAGLYLSGRAGASAWDRFRRSLGRGIVLAAPWLMKGLSLAGTIAMFLVGGGILTHGLTPLHHLIEAVTQWASEVGTIGGVLGTVTPLAVDGLVGVAAGALVLLGVTGIKRIKA
jgi:predicted DNA repair protein MutK